MQVVERARVDRSPAAVWAVLADFGAINRWADNVVHSNLVTEQRDGIGAVRRVQVGRNALLERIVVWEPGVRVGYDIEGLPIVRRVTNTWHLEEAGATTQLSLTSHVDTVPIVRRIIGQVLAMESRKLLAGLKAHVEANP